MTCPAPPGKPEFTVEHLAALKEFLDHFRGTFMEYHAAYKVLDLYVKELELWKGPLRQI